MTEATKMLPTVDARYHALRRGDLHFQFPEYKTLAEWEQRAAWLREHLLVTLGLWPLPERGPLNAQVFGRIDYEDYSIEKAYFESWPGFYCTGNLYRPRQATGRVPGILNPHGHWEHGRLEHQPLGSIRARCITFARMGMVAFAYDMVGYNDSLQVPRHHLGTPRGALWGLSTMALQTWNSVRAIDFMESLPDVDRERIGCTGASGGGTQTFTVTAIDPRLKVVAPVNMISAHMQGGCICENIPGLRTDTYNVEIGALTAPRPMFMVSATGDWTVNTPNIEYPAIRSIYRLYGAEERVATAQVDAPHNYNAQSRDYVYRWFARWFLGDESLGRGAERDFVVEPDERMRVFPTGELPAGTLKNEALEASLRAGAEHRLHALFPTTGEGLDKLRQITRTRLEHTLGVTVPQAADVLAEPGQAARQSGGGEEWVLGRRGQGDRIPATCFQPGAGASRGAVLLVHPAGRAALRDSFGGPESRVRALLAEGFAVWTIDAFDTGEVPADAVARNELDWFYSTFNPPTLGRRVQDIVTALAYLAGQGEPGRVLLAGLGEAGPWTLLAAALSPVAARVYADMQAVQTDGDDAYLTALYAPLMGAYGGLPVAAALVAPRALLLGNTAGRFPIKWAQAAYDITDAAASLSESAEPLDAAELAAWLDLACDPA